MTDIHQRIKTAKQVTTHAPKPEIDPQLITDTPDADALQRAINSPTQDTLTPSVVTSIQRLYGNQYANNLIQQSRQDDIDDTTASTDTISRKKKSKFGRQKKIEKQLKKLLRKDKVFMRKGPRWKSKRQAEHINTNYAEKITEWTNNFPKYDSMLVEVFAEQGYNVQFKRGIAKRV